MGCGAEPPQGPLSEHTCRGGDEGQGNTGYRLGSGDFHPGVGTGGKNFKVKLRLWFSQRCWLLDQD